MADALISEVWKILSYTRVLELVIILLRKNKYWTRGCWLLIFTATFKNRRIIYTYVADSGLFLPAIDLVLAHTLCRNVFVIGGFKRDL